MGTEKDAGSKFAAELGRWRTKRDLSKAALAKRLNVSPSYISHLEAGREHGSADLARRADAELQAGGALWAAWQNGGTPAPAGEPKHTASLAPGLLVLDDEAALSYDGNTYHLTMRRRLCNVGAEPVTRYLVRISVDRYPDEPERSNTLYRANPLSWEELALAAYCGTEPMTWSIKHDKDAFKELWLQFANRRTRFPLYPGQETEITYSYSVSDTKWGCWFQRAVRLPTRRLSVELAFPHRTEPTVWGTETSMSAELAALPTPPHRSDRAGQTVFTWSTVDPPLHARYRLEWRLNTSTDGENSTMTTLSPSQAMAGAGIIQDGDPVLAATAPHFDLPAEADQARDTIRDLLAAIDRVKALHTFGKGMGIAAPQLGISRSAAVIVPTDTGAEPIVLLNASVAEASADEDVQYEGCLSFFDVRGRVPRPLHIIVEHTDLDGTPRLSRFDHATARLVAHELDHLNGVLYRQRMRPEEKLLPVEEYWGTGRQWSYEPDRPTG
ncbi:MULTISPECIES: peptide deformylase [Streptomyces]|uniref:peptide deformylase n=1 Tax=Streptomyces TaxID=1883 RepID=UPI00163B70B0|nr:MULTISPECIES: peptide deformylase [Streptomyces]MBC2879315.1 peptide deformylase [Streptomyces sp. TYQ1024]UBI40085.1 peptide deformylase [Streptomyces mobaraensis]UKW32664.1 peptide deformylase [Streptomyces sp. TYQ1024]